MTSVDGSMPPSSATTCVDNAAAAELLADRPGPRGVRAERLGDAERGLRGPRHGGHRRRAAAATGGLPRLARPRRRSSAIRGVSPGAPTDPWPSARRPWHSCCWRPWRLGSLGSLAAVGVGALLSPNGPAPTVAPGSGADTESVGASRARARARRSARRRAPRRRRLRRRRQSRPRPPSRPKHRKGPTTRRARGLARGATRRGRGTGDDISRARVGWRFVRLRSGGDSSGSGSGG